MEGVDIHLDVSVGKQLSALGHTLTMLTGIGIAHQTVYTHWSGNLLSYLLTLCMFTGFEEEDPLKMDYDSDLDDEADNSKDSQVRSLTLSSVDCKTQVIDLFQYK